MKKFTLKTAMQATMASMALIALGSVYAQTTPPAAPIISSGTINFLGQISATTCTVKAGDRNKTVSMATVAPATFTTAVQTAGQTPFSITLEGCTAGAAGATSAVVGFGGINNEGRFTTSGTATGVDIVINAAAGTALTRQGSELRSASTTLTAGTNTFDFSAAYTANGGTIGAGTANAAATFQIIYQ